MKILVTGSASPLALALLPTLAADERIKQIIGLDQDESQYDAPNFTQVLLDPRSPQVGRVIAQVQAVVHLANLANLDRPGDPAVQRELNIQGTQNLFLSALEHGVTCFVYASSAAVYALPSRQRPIEETHPRGPLSGFAWSHDMVAVEDWFDIVEKQESVTRLVRLRPALVTGKNASLCVDQLLGGLFSIRFSGRPPKLQCVHVDDLAHAILEALTREDARGAFNLASSNAATLAQMQRLCGRGWVSLPFPLVYRLHRFRGRLDAAWIEAFRHDLVLDSNRARRRLHWKPRHDTVASCLNGKEE